MTEKLAWNQLNQLIDLILDKEKFSAGNTKLTSCLRTKKTFYRKHLYQARLILKDLRGHWRAMGLKEHQTFRSFVNDIRKRGFDFDAYSDKRPDRQLPSPDKPTQPQA